MNFNFQNILVFASFLLVLLNLSLVQSEAFSLGEKSPGLKLKDGLPLKVIIKQGELSELPATIEFDKNYEIENMQLTLEDLPLHVQGWIKPNSLQNEIDSKSISNATLSVLVGSEAHLGNYIIKITGNGILKDQITGNYTTVTNQTIGELYVTVKSNSSPIRMNIGSPQLHENNFCVKDIQGFAMCNSFVAYEEFPITLYSQNKTTVQLASHILEDSWIKFVPEKITVGPNGSSTKIIMSGIEKPLEINPMVTKVMIIQAESDEGNTTDFLPIIKTQNLTVLDSPHLIELGSEIGPNINSINYGIFGVVYDPLGYSKSLPVSLSVLGLVKDDEIVSLPSWLQVDIPKPSFDLNATIPYYFMITVYTPNAPAGNYVVAIKENIGGKQFIQNLKISLMTPPFMETTTHGGNISNSTSAILVTRSSSISSMVATPLKQFRSGIPIIDVQCKQDLKLVIKSEDGTPACVKPDAIEKLVQWGWAKIPNSIK